MKFPRLIIIICVLLGSLTAQGHDREESVALTDSSEWVRLVRRGGATKAKAVRELPAERTWLFGVGRGDLYDAYLSPLDYAGPTASVTMQNERQARWNRHVASFARFSIDGTYAHNPSHNAQYYDGALNVSFGWHRRWQVCRERLLIGVGGLAAFDIGGTYSNRNGNNPAQGRAALALGPSVQVRYAFRAPRRLRLTYVKAGEPGCVDEKPWTVAVQAEAPLVGVAFSPQYGQSYYELFELGNYDHNVCFTHPFNAPSVRLAATLGIPVGRSTELVVGYRGQALQSRLNGLSRHDWTNGAVIGFKRYLKL